jgi:hypothetical protein
VGVLLGAEDGLEVGAAEGETDGIFEGALVGDSEGDSEGDPEGDSVGDPVGEGVASQSRSGIQGRTNSYEHEPISSGMLHVSGTICEAWSISLERIVTLTSVNPSEQKASIGDVIWKPPISLNVSHVNSPLASTNCTANSEISFGHVLVMKNSTKSIFIPVVSVMIGVSSYKHNSSWPTSDNTTKGSSKQSGIGASQRGIQGRVSLYPT